MIENILIAEVFCLFQYSIGNSQLNRRLLCQIFWGATASTFIPSELSMMTDLGESRKGENFGIVHAFRGIGGIPTGILGGFLIEYVHFLAPFIITTVGVALEKLLVRELGKEFSVLGEAAREVGETDKRFKGKSIKL